MQGHHSKQGKKVDRVIVSDDPHENYRRLNPLTGETLSPGVPILHRVDGRMILSKELKTKQVICSDCGAEARYDDGEPICPQCGMVCTGPGADSVELVIDEKAAERVQ